MFRIMSGLFFFQSQQFLKTQSHGSSSETLRERSQDLYPCRISWGIRSCNLFHDCTLSLCVNCDFVTISNYQIPENRRHKPYLFNSIWPRLKFKSGKCSIKKKTLVAVSIFFNLQFFYFF